MEEVLSNDVLEVVEMEPIESSGGNIVTKIVIGGAVLVLTGVAAWAYKKHKDNKNNDEESGNKKRSHTIGKQRSDDAEEYSEDEQN